MEINPFKDLLFQILNENDFFFEDIELDDKNNCFIIRCTDGSRFLLKVQKTVSHFCDNDEFSHLQRLTGELSIHNDTSLSAQLARDNPYVFLILIVILKLSELQIISDEEAQRLISQVQPHTQKLKEQWKQNKTI